MYRILEIQKIDKNDPDNVIDRTFYIIDGSGMVIADGGPFVSIEDALSRLTQIEMDMSDDEQPNITP